MSDLYRADASNFTREQLVELINIQTNLQLEANKTIVIAKGKIEELEHKLALAKEALVRILSSEALKEAPFYSYSEAILIGREVLVRLK